MASPAASIGLILSADLGNQRSGNSFVVGSWNGFDLAITCAHVVADLGGQTSLLCRGIPAEVVLEASEPLDIALLQVIAHAGAPPLSPARQVREGQRVSVVGYVAHASGFVARRLDATVESATVIAGRGSEPNVPAWELVLDGKETLEPGLSGSPVLNRAGEVVGVLQSRTGEGARGLMIDACRLTDVWPDLSNRIDESSPWRSRAIQPANHMVDHSAGAGAFVGRQGEVETLVSQMRSAHSSRGGVAFVTGRPGTGKSALIEHVMLEVLQAYPYVAQALARTDPLAGRHVSYGLFKTTLEQILEWSQTNGDGEALDAVAEALADLGIRDLASWPAFAGSQTRRLTSRLNEMTARDRGIPSRVEALLSQGALLEAYTAVLLALSKRQPVLMTFEDIHWADESSMILLTHLARGIEDSRIFIICTLRREDLDENELAREAFDRLCKPGTTPIDLDLTQLSLAERRERQARFCSEYIASRYGQEIAQQIGPTLAEVSSGNALFLTEVLYDLEERGVIERGPSSWHLTRTAGVDDLPRRLEVLLRERVGRLDGSLLDIIQCGAVEGESFTAEVAARISGTTDSDVLSMVSDHLMRVHRLVMSGGQRRLGNGAHIHSFHFDHALTRKFVYEQTLTPQERRQIHSEVARCIAELWADSPDQVAPQVAVHFDLAHDLENAALYSLRAAQVLSREYAWSEVVQFARIGMKARETRLKSPVPISDKLYRELTYYYCLGESEGGVRSEQVDHIQAGLTALLPLLADRESYSTAEQGRSFLLEGKLRASRGVDNHADALLRRAADCFEEIGDEENLVASLSVQVYDTNLVAYSDAAAAELERRLRCLAIAERLDSLPLVVKSLGDLAVSYLNLPVGEPDQLAKAEELSLRGLALSRELGTPQTTDAELVQSWVMHHRGRYGRHLLGQREHVLNLARINRQSVLEAEALTDLGHYRALTVDGTDAAEAALRRALAFRLSLGRHAVHDRENLAAFLWRQGRLGEAIELLEQSLPEASASRLLRTKAQISWYRGLLGHRAADLDLELPDLLAIAEAGDVYGALACLEVGASAAALELAERAAIVADDSVVRGVFHSYVDTHTVLADIFMRLGIDGRPEHHVARATKAWRDLGERTDVENLVMYWPFRLTVGRHLLHVGKLEEASAVLADAEQGLTRAGDWRRIEARLLLNGPALREYCELPGGYDMEGALESLGIPYLNGMSS